MGTRQSCVISPLANPLTRLQQCVIYLTGPEQD